VGHAYFVQVWKYQTETELVPAAWRLDSAQLAANIAARFFHPWQNGVKKCGCLPDFRIFFNSSAPVCP
jgi:hypothetical protein